MIVTLNHRFSMMTACDCSRQTLSRDAQVNHRAARSIDAAMSDIDRNRTHASSFEGTNPRRIQKSAASPSTALTTSARPPIRRAAVTERSNACFSSPSADAFACAGKICSELPKQQAGNGIRWLTGSN